MKLFDDHGSLSIDVQGVHAYLSEIELAELNIPPESPWLDVHIEAQSPAGSWTCEGDLFELHNVPFIAGWFRALADGRDTHREIYFEEPNLAFEAIGEVASGLRLRVTLDAMCRPPWAPGIAGDLPDPSFEILVTSPMLRAAAKDLEDQIRRLGLS